MILKFFLFYALVCLIIISVAGLGLFIGYCCASSKDCHFIHDLQISYSRMNNTISSVRAQCEKLQDDLLNKTKLTIYHELRAIQENLILPKPDPTNRCRKAPLFLYSGVSMIGLLLTTQVLTALLCLFLFGTIGVSLIAGSMISDVDNQLYSVIFKYSNINMDLYSSLTNGDCTLLETGVWIIVAIIFIILSISLITRIIRLIVCQCEIIFMGCRISVSILLTDLTKAQITEEFEQLSQDIQSRNLSSYIGKIMHRIFD